MPEVDVTTLMQELTTVLQQQNLRFQLFAV